TMLAAFKIRAVPINVNYRYVETELLYLYRDSDIVALVYDVEFDDRVAGTAPQAPALDHLVAVGGPSTVAGAVRYDEAIEGRPDTRGFEPRSSEDTYIIYTGGTTGMPKGVMWGMKDLFFAFGNPAMEPPKKPEDVIENARNAGPLIMMPVAP